MDFSGILTNVKDWFFTALSGVSLTTVIGLIVYALTSIKKLKSNGANLAEELGAKLESAINEKVIPSTVKVDITSAVNREVSRIVQTIMAHQDVIEKKDDAILKILTSGTIFSSFPKDVQSEILSLIGETATETADLEVHLSTPEEIAQSPVTKENEVETQIFVR